jgi:hypothetical protein
MRLRSWTVTVLFLFLQGCGGSSGGGGGTPNPPGGGGGGGGGTSQNPCPTSALTAETFSSRLQEERRADKKRAIDGDSRYRVFDSLSLHREAQQWRERAGRSRTSSCEAEAEPLRRRIDIGEIAVVQDEGDLIAPANVYDLRGLGLRFTRNPAGGYDVVRVGLNFRTSLGRQLTLEDDDSEPANVTGFTFNFYGRPQSTAFVNSDGNVTFEEPDSSSTERNVARLTTGPPRIAPFLADLDPSVGGRVFVNAAADQYVVTWCSVRGFESTRTITTQAVLLPDGNMEMHFSDATAGLTDAVVGISPGRTGEFRSVDLSAQASNAGGSSSVGERFATIPLLDNVAVAKKFYASHPDDYDQLVIWTDARLIQDAFAFEQTVANDILGIGIPTFDASREFGSAGRLDSTLVMDFLGKYPDDPHQTFLGENNTVSVLGQEAGHRWLVFTDFRDHTGSRSDQLLGRDDSHWSFFMDSDASVMEGNDIEDLGGGSFRTVGAVRRYSLLDQYAMGLVGPGDVPTFFYVQNPTNVSPVRNRESAPQIGVTFNGTRRDVRIEDIIAIHGPRAPNAANSPREHRQAFIYVSSAGRSPDASQIDKLDRIRRAWEEFFLQATDGRMRAVTTLR